MINDYGMDICFTHTARPFMDGDRFHRVAAGVGHDLALRGAVRSRCRAAVIGGAVIFGSNTSTSKQAAAAIKAAEALRAELIGMIDLRSVEEAKC